MAEDVNFLTNRYQLEKLPTATLMKMGNDFMNIKNMPDSAMLCYSLIANRYNENLKGEELKQCIRATCYAGRIYANYFNNHSMAYEYYLKSIDLANNYYEEFLSDIYLDLGNLFWHQQGLNKNKDYFNQALNYYKIAFKKAVSCKHYRELPVIFINLNYIALTYNKLQSIKKENDTFENLPIPESAHMYSYAKVIDKGMNLIAQGKTEQAIKLLKNTTINETEIKTQANMQIMLNEFIYYAQIQCGKDKEAFNTLMLIKDLVIHKLPELTPGLYDQLTMYYKKHHNTVLADKYELLNWRTSDSLSEITKADKMISMKFLHEIDKMNEEHKALTIKQQHDRQMLWIVSGFLMLTLFLLALLFINRYRIKRKNRVLYENNMALLAADEQRRQMDENQNRTVSEKYGTTRMDEQSTEELWQNITHVMKYSQEIFDESFNVARLAELVDAKPNYVSQAINQQEEWSFSSLLAHYRIREACRRMNDSANYGSYTIEGIAQSVGYSSRSHFVKLFKKQTGLTPSDYIKQAKSKNTNSI